MGPTFHTFNAGPATRFALSATSIDGSGTGAFAMDDVAVIAGVPEPASWAMLLSGFGLADDTLRRRTRQAAYA